MVMHTSQCNSSINIISMESAADGHPMSRLRSWRHNYMYSLPHIELSLYKNSFV